MASASWHAQSCVGPKVVIDADKRPACGTCGRVFRRGPRIDSRASAASGLPSYKPQQSRLRWPPSIPYSDALQFQERPHTPITASGSDDNGKYSDLIPAWTEVKPAALSLPQNPSSELYAQQTHVEYNVAAVATASAATPVLTHPALVQGRLIRILRLSPGQGDDPVHGVLEIVRLDDNPQYDALSYTWADEQGDRSTSREIFLGPEWTCFPVTANCFAAVRRLRH